MNDPIAIAAARFAGIDILRLPLDEAIPVMQVLLTRNLSKRDREEMMQDLDKPLVFGQPDATPEDEDAELLRILGMPGLKRPIARADPPRVLD